jgi:3-methyladenine DNA glycosylase/8-oxoguanine DNA glycosylase
VVGGEKDNPLNFGLLLHIDIPERLGRRYLFRRESFKPYRNCAIYYAFNYLIFSQAIYATNM